jgi:hypothetical protein
MNRQPGEEEGTRQSFRSLVDFVTLMTLSNSRRLEKLASKEQSFQRVAYLDQEIWTDRSRALLLQQFDHLLAAASVGRKLIMI